MYRYNSDQTQSFTDIRSDFPNRQTKLPIIVVNVGNGNANVTYVGDEFNRNATIEKDGIDGYVYGGILRLNVDINIYGGTMRDTEHLSDLTALYMRYLFREKFYANNMAYVEVSVGKISSDSEDKLGDYFMNTISTEVTTSFEQIIEKDLYDKIQNININFGADIK